MITKPQALKAMDNETMCYAADGQSVTVVAVTWGEQWKVEVEYSDGSRAHRNPADITLSTVYVYAIHREDSASGLYSQDPDFSLEYGTRAECLAVIRELRSWQPAVKRRCIELICTD